MSVPSHFARRVCAVSFLVMLGAWQTTAHATGLAYSGRATAVRATANILNSSTRVVLGDTGEINPKGDTRDATVVQFDNPPPTEVHVDLLEAIASGANWVSAASSAVHKVDIKTSRVTITADQIEADSTATCHPESTTVSTHGSSILRNLRINGVPISTASRPPNSRITLGGGITVIFNEQIRPDVNTIHVNALHVKVPTIPGLAGADIVISHVESGILTCAWEIVP